MLDNEDLIVLVKAAAWIAERTGGRRPNISTLHRWATRGVRGVRLETVAVGHVRYTSIEAVRRFLSAKPTDPTPITEVSVAPRRAVECREKPVSRAAEMERRLFRGGKSRRQVAGA
jgi:hypothetical protein